MYIYTYFVDIAIPYTGAVSKYTFETVVTHIEIHNT